MQPCCFFVTLCPDAFSKLFLIYVKPQLTIFDYVLMLFHSTVPWQRISGCCICCGLSAYTWYTWTCSHRTLIDEITRTHCACSPSRSLPPSLALLRCVHLFFLVFQSRSSGSAVHLPILIDLTRRLRRTQGKARRERRQRRKLFRHHFFWFICANFALFYRALPPPLGSVAYA